MIISHKYKFIFIKTTKTAGTSIELFLEQHCGDNDIVTPIYPPEQGHKPRNYKGIFNPIEEILMGGGRAIRAILNFIQQEKFYNHIYARSVRARVSSDIWDNYYKFTVERHPVSKTISHYNMLKYRANGNLTIEEYFRKGKFCINYPIYMDEKDNILVDRIIRYENLNQELGEVFFKLGIPFDGTLNTQAKSEYKEKNSSKIVFSEEQKIILADVFSKEMKVFNYTID